MADSTNRGPVAPKDPTKKRPFFYITKDKEIFGAPQPDGSLAHFLYMDMGRLIDAARLTGNVTDEAMIGNLTTRAGIQKMVHSIGVSVSGKDKGSKVKFVAEMYPNTPGEETTNIETELLMDGMESVIELGTIDWKDGDKELGQIRFLFDKPGITATTDVRFYLNDGFEAPEQPDDKAVDFSSDDYRKMIERKSSLPLLSEIPNTIHFSPNLKHPKGGFAVHLQQK